MDKTTLTGEQQKRIYNRERAASKTFQTAISAFWRAKLLAGVVSKKVVREQFDLVNGLAASMVNEALQKPEQSVDTKPLATAITRLEDMVREELVEV